MSKTIVCPACDGAGWSGTHTCERCHGTGNVKRPMTNADRLRACSDEELAKNLAVIAMGVQASNEIGIKYPSLEWMQEKILTYLRRIAEEDNGNGN